MLKYIRHAITIILLVTFHVISAQTTVKGLHFQTGKPVAVKIRDGKIIRVRHLVRLKDENRGVYIAPGLIDNQVNGFAGVSFDFGKSSLTPSGVRLVTRELWKKGVTSYLATLTTNSREVLMKNLLILAREKEDTSLLGSMAGIHLEGPYISPVDGYRGAHPLAYVRKPDWEEFSALYKASGNNILTVTLAPETEGAMDFIRKCRSLGIVVALGHHNAPKSIVDEAVLNGARISTHLGNGCANMINRHDNPLWPQLANDQLMASIICDGFHLRDEEIRTFYKVKGPGKTIVTSDVTSFAGMPPGIYKNEEGETVELSPEGRLSYPAQNVLYGSATPISVGVVHIMQVTGCTPGDAFRMTSTNPATLYGLTDRGSLEPGKRADLILFTFGEKDLNIRKTYVKGVLVYDVNKEVE